MELLWWGGKGVELSSGEFHQKKEVQTFRRCFINMPIHIGNAVTEKDSIEVKTGENSPGTPLCTKLKNKRNDTYPSNYEGFPNSLFPKVLRRELLKFCKGWKGSRIQTAKFRAARLMYT